MDKSRVGVLFVHGIGLHQRGETLRGFGEPFVDWLSKWLAGAGGGWGARVADARLDPGEDTPAFAQVAVSAPDGEQTWTLCESWWAEKFQPPRYRELLIWAVGIVPLTVLTHFALGVYRRAGIVRGLLLFLAGMLLSPLLVAALLLILLLGVVPAGPVRQFARNLQRLLASTVGDSYVLLASPIQSAAIEGQVRRDLAWLAGRAESVCVIAHSQGAALAHRVLQAGAPPNVKTLVTVGSGLDKLLRIEGIEHSATRWRVWFSSLALVYLAWVAEVTYLNLRLLGLRASLGVLAGYILVGAWLGFTQAKARWVKMAGWAGAAAALGASWYWAAEAMVRTGMLWVFALPGLALLAWASAPAWNLRHPGKERLRLPPSIRWVDLYASADPVPNGPLAASWDFAPCRSCEVANRRSVLTDHTSYWENSEQVLFACVAEAGAAAGLRLDLLGARDTTGQAPRRRCWRTAWLAAARWIALAFSLVLPARLWDRLPADAGPLRDTLAPLMRYAGAVTPRAAWALLVCAAVWLFYFVEAAVWRWWDRGEADRLFAREDYRTLSAPFCVFGFLLLAGIEWGVMLALRPGAAPGVPALASLFGAYGVAAPVALQEASGEFLSARFARNLAGWGLFYWLALFPPAPWILSLQGSAVNFRWGFGIYLGVIVLTGQLLGWQRLRARLAAAWERWSHARLAGIE